MSKQHENKLTTSARKANEQTNTQKIPLEKKHAQKQAATTHEHAKKTARDKQKRTHDTSRKRKQTKKKTRARTRNRIQRKTKN